MDLMKLIMSTPSILPSILVLLSIAVAVKILNAVWLRPRKLERLLRKQGIYGNKYRFLIGDLKDLAYAPEAEQLKSIDLSDDLPSHIMPYFKKITNTYGKRSLVWFGPTPRLNIYEPELIKEILAKPDVYQKPSLIPIVDKIVGGLFFLEGEKWAKHRKLVNPAFHAEKLKNMQPAMLLSCSNMVKKWEDLISSSPSGASEEIDVWPYLQALTVETISRTAFGSSHEEGRRIHELQNIEINDVTKNLNHLFIPGWRYVPTKANRRLRSSLKEINSLVRGIIDRREKENGTLAHDEDLLGTLLGSNTLSIDDVIAECKLFYFGGSETTSNWLVWTMVMLSKHPGWQERARDEVFRVFGSEQEPSFDALGKLKILTMILNEVLRLYPPAPITIRAPTRDVELGDMMLPDGVELTLLIGMLHHDVETWGEDAAEFRPERFAGGVSGKKINKGSYVPFSAGPRVCVGQNFATNEAKMAMAMVLQRFSFELSPEYVHAPFPTLTLGPQHGAALVLHKL